MPRLPWEFATVDPRPIDPCAPRKGDTPAIRELIEKCQTLEKLCRARTTEIVNTYEAPGFTAADAHLLPAVEHLDLAELRRRHAALLQEIEDERFKVELEREVAALDGRRKKSSLSA